jgi:heme A synthase
MKNILKTASIIGIFATALLLIAWILGLATTKELQEVLLKLMGVIGVLTAAGVATVFVTAIGGKK